MDKRRRAFLASVAATVGLSGCSGLVDVESGPTLDEVRTAWDEGNPGSAGNPLTTPDREPVDEQFEEDVRARASEVGTSVRDSVVVLRDDNRGGTGWFVGDGEIVTNAHVVDGSSALSVETFDGTTGTAERVGYYEDLRPDLALLETELSGPPLPLGSVDELSRGDPLVAVGHPGRLGEWLISLGRYLRVVDGIDWLLSTVPAENGNSGGPLVTLEGEVVGVVSGSTTGTRGERPDYSKNETAYTEFPEVDEQTTSVPVDVLEQSLSDWR